MSDPWSPWIELLPDDKATQQRRMRGRPSVYVFLARTGEPLYVGQAQDSPMRWQQHRRIQPWWSEVYRILALPMWDRVADELSHPRYVFEQRLIRKLQPLYNVRGRY